MPEKQPPHVKSKPGASWKGTEQHVLPKNRLGIVFLGLCCCTFLAAIDQVIVHSSLAGWLIYSSQ
jgi:hypothetical protein